MSFVTYRATKDISLGQLRRGLRAGDLVEFDGTTTRVDGKDHRISTMDAVIQNKWLVPVGAPPVEEHALTVMGVNLPAVVDVAVEPVKTPRKPQEPNHAPPAREDQALDTRGEKIGYASPAARAASGKRPAPSQQHVWGGGSTTAAPDWLNADGGRVCRVCGVTELRPGDLIRADRKRGDGSQQIHYRDAHGNQITSFEELSCPTYLGDPGSAAAIAKDQVRKVRGRVDDVEDQLETVDERLAQLESDNGFFRQRLLEQPVLDATMVAEALLLIASGRVGGKNVLAERVRALLPDYGEIVPDILRPVLDAEIVEAAPVKSTDDP